MFFLSFSVIFPICLKGALMFAVSLVGFVFISENVEENEKGEGKGARERDFRQSVPLSACFGNTECVSEAKRIGSFLLVLLACFRLLAFAGVLALLASVASPALLDLTCLPCLAFPRLLACLLVCLLASACFCLRLLLCLVLLLLLLSLLLVLLLAVVPCFCMFLLVCCLTCLLGGWLAGLAGLAGWLIACFRFLACVLACLPARFSLRLMLPCMCFACFRSHACLLACLPACMFSAKIACLLGLVASLALLAPLALLAWP